MSERWEGRNGAEAAPGPDPGTSPTGTVASSSPPVPDRDGADHTNDHDAPAAAVAHAIPPRCKARTRLYRDGGLQAEGFPATEISDHLRDDRATVWLDLFDSEIDDLTVITDEFGLHPLAVEDAVHDHERPKLDRYRDHLFLSAYAVRLPQDVPARPGWAIGLPRRKESSSAGAAAQPGDQVDDGRQHDRAQ